MPLIFKIGLIVLLSIVGYLLFRGRRYYVEMEKEKGELISNSQIWKDLVNKYKLIREGKKHFSHRRVKKEKDQ
jgi:hypothetical protein